VGKILSWQLIFGSLGYLIEDVMAQAMEARAYLATTPMLEMKQKC
jgi:hypothetical protein